MIRRKLIQLLAVFCVVISPGQAETARPALVLIIDDLGNSRELGQRAIALPGKINLSFLPHVKNTQELAQAGHQRGHDIMLHAPMSNLAHLAMGPGALTEEMDETQFRTTLREAIASIPHAKGVNNHMGSLLTQHSEPMAWLMDELKRQQLFFIDSRTSAQTVAASQAKSHQVPHLQRHVFLDHVRNIDAIEMEFERLLTIAQHEGLAVGIGHPYPETLSFLEKTLPTLSSRGIIMVYASEALQQNSKLAKLGEKPQKEEQVTEI